MAASEIVAVHREVSVQLSDGAGTPNTLTPPRRIASLVLPNNPGTHVYVMSQGVRVGRKKTEDPLHPFTLQFHFTEATNASAVIVDDFIGFKGSASGHTSTTGPEFDGKSIDIQVTIDKTSGDKDDNANAVITYSDCFLVDSSVDETGDTLVVSYDFEALSRTETGQS